MIVPFSRAMRYYHSNIESIALGLKSLCFFTDFLVILMLHDKFLCKTFKVGSGQAERVRKAYECSTWMKMESRPSCASMWTIMR